MSNPTNIFNFVAHDILQYVLNPFLTADDRFNLNAVLEPTERIFKRFPTDFAIKHSLKAFITTQKRCSIRSAEIIAQLDRITPDKNTMKPLRHYVTFLTSLHAKLIFEYRMEAKRGALRDLHFFLDEDSIATFIGPKLRQRILDAIDIVEDTTFLRHIPFE